MKEWMEKYDWGENPFNFKIYPGLLVGYKEEIRSLAEIIDAENKFSMVTGPTGAGKTNLLKWLASENGDGREIYYMPKPPTNEKDLLEYLKEEILEPGFLSRFFKSYSLYNIYGDLEESIDKPALLMVDEGHEASVEVWEWMRTALDHVDNLTILAAGLEEFEETLEDEVNTLYSRATKIVNLHNLGRDETIQLIRKRIEKAGGDSIEPFTQEALLEIYRQTEGFPREVLRACNDCVVRASREKMSVIDENDVKEIVGKNESQEDDEGDESRETVEDESDEADMNLTPKQKQVLEVLKEEGRCTSGDLVDIIGVEDYSSRSHAIRSFNNILSRLLENGVVDRERKGRSYVYYVKD
ncbi:MAG: AAA family ATPase [Candidatus Nanohaloarchaeota archaeon QJJ-9]|nr:AAA family ATPase [Candidatus Nanohaloarchaeota archaeon QJJ-9]